MTSRVVVVGGGIAGLGAARELLRSGHQVTVLEAQETLGGRCRSVQWHGEWLITGAMAFSEHDTNVAALAEELHIRDGTDGTVNLTDAHRERMLRGDGVVELDGFTVTGLLGARGIPAREKAALARALPALLRLNTGSPARRTRALNGLDAIDACGYLRRFAPTFVDYVVEPTMAMFCGYEAGDYSLGWLLSNLGPLRLRDRATNDGTLGWWTLETRGVGALTWALADALESDTGCDIRTSTRVERVETGNSGVCVHLGGESLHAQACVIAVQGTRVSQLLPDLHPDQLQFLDAIRYRGHHIAYFLTEHGSVQPPNSGGGDSSRESVGLILPTVEGYHVVSNLSVRTIAEGTLVYAEMKGGTCDRLRDKTDDEVLDTCWAELMRVIPGAPTATVTDRLLSRNNDGLCTYPVGYRARMDRFLAAPENPQLVYAGDWLATCSVGSSLKTGARAAKLLTTALS